MIKMWKQLQRMKARETREETDLKKKYGEFLAVLFENESCLDLMSRLETKLYGNQLVSYPYLKAMADTLSKRTANIIESLIYLSGGEHTVLRQVNNRLNRGIRQVLTGTGEPIYTPMIIPLAFIEKSFVDKVGNKMANLGDLYLRYGRWVPDGFSATACAYNYFMEYNNLAAKIRDVVGDLNPEDSGQLLAAEKEIKSIFLAGDIPPEIEHAVRQEAETLERKKGRPLFWAVRSSAIGEDMAESSFAGQFSTKLNIPTARLFEAYKEVASSKYNAHVMVYQRLRHIRDDDVAMSVGFMEMRDPVCSGVLYTRNPVEPEAGEIVVNAVWGIGELLVEGIVSADVYVLGRSEGFPLVREETAEKEVSLTLSPRGGLQQQVVDGERSGRRCLDRDQLNRLAEMALQVEAHFKGPQDIEWCFDRENRLCLLQSRPLRIVQDRDRPPRARVTGAEVIAADTQPISPGTACGKVFKARSVHDLSRLPRQGAVLVLRHSSPRFIGAFRKVEAVIVERGNWTDHMASVIREFALPCVVRAAGIFDKLSDGQIVSLDAGNGIIYAGSVPSLEGERVPQPLKKAPDLPMTESFNLLSKMAEFIFPLNLTDPRQPDFSAESCRTWHDILRFCHETALNEMFLLNEKNRLQAVKNVFRVAADLPFTLFVLDIVGTAVRETRDSDVIPPGDVLSLPFQNLWKGMTDPDLDWQGQGPRLPAADRKTYAVVAPDYLNLSLSLGHHFIVIDGYLSDDVYNNYITLSFKDGGEADGLQWQDFVSKVLTRMDFDVSVTPNFLKARLKAESAGELGGKLRAVGHMFGLTHLGDPLTADEEMAANCIARSRAS